MELNLPILDQLLSCKNLLIAGMSGAFDVFCGLPIYFELKKHGSNAHLANFSFQISKESILEPASPGHWWGFSQKRREFFRTFLSFIWPIGSKNSEMKRSRSGDFTKPEPHR